MKKIRKRWGSWRRSRSPGRSMPPGRTRIWLRGILSILRHWRKVIGILSRRHRRPIAGSLRRLTRSILWRGCSQKIGLKQSRCWSSMNRIKRRLHLLDAQSSRFERRFRKKSSKKLLKKKELLIKLTFWFRLVMASQRLKKLKELKRERGMIKGFLWFIGTNRWVQKRTRRRPSRIPEVTASIQRGTLYGVFRGARTARGLMMISVRVGQDHLREEIGRSARKDLILITKAMGPCHSKRRKSTDQIIFMISIRGFSTKRTRIRRSCRWMWISWMFSTWRQGT